MCGHQWLPDQLNLPPPTAEFKDSCCHSNAAQTLQVAMTEGRLVYLCRSSATNCLFHLLTSLRYPLILFQPPCAHATEALQPNHQPTTNAAFKAFNALLMELHCTRHTNCCILLGSCESQSIYAEVAHCRSNERHSSIWMWSSWVWVECECACVCFTFFWHSQINRERLSSLQRALCCSCLCLHNGKISSV